MVVKRISRRRKKSSSPRRKSRRKSKQKKRSRVRRRSKNKLEGGAAGRRALRAKKAIGAVTRLPEKVITALNDAKDEKETALLEDWGKSVNKEEFASYGTGDDARKKMLADARKWKQAQTVDNVKKVGRKIRGKTVDNVKKVGRKIRGKTYILLVKKNKKDGSTCVYKPKNEKMTFKDLQNMLIREGGVPIADIVSSTPVYQ